MDFNCSYIDKKTGDCKSPLAEKREYVGGCFCSDYRQCFYFPQSELNDIIKPEKGNNLERKAER